MAVKVDFGEFLAAGGEGVFFFDDLGVAGGVVGIGEVVVEALGEAAARDELGEAVAVGVVGEVDYNVSVRSADQPIVEAVNVGGVGSSAE